MMKVRYGDPPTHPPTGFQKHCSTASAPSKRLLGGGGGGFGKVSRSSTGGCTRSLANSRALSYPRAALAGYANDLLLQRHVGSAQTSNLCRDVPHRYDQAIFSTGGFWVKKNK